MKINKLFSKHILKNILGYTFVLYRHLDEKNNTCFTLTVKNQKEKEKTILKYPAYISAIFLGAIEKYIKNKIEY